jgi:8-amino-7-oxononanoate synthase
LDIFEKANHFTEHRKVQEMGLYPYFRPVSSAEDTEVIIEGKRVIMLGSNNYLGLTTHPKVKEAALRAIEEYGTSSCGSRFLNGTLSLHLRLEEKLAAFIKKERALVFSTGFQTNLGTISALVGKDDVVILDKWNHASIVDGARLSFGEIRRFRHNDMEDLERVLKEVPSEKGKLIVVDGLFSMEGDLANLPGIVELAKKYNARLMVDDAHAIGVMGANGRGTPEHFGVEKDVDLVMGTFSKSFASLGGFIAGPAHVIEYIQHHARSLIFSASMPPPNIATVEAALEIIQNEPERRERLWENTGYMRQGLKHLGFDTGLSETPVIPVVIGDDMLTFRFWRELFDEGVYTNPVISPAVPPGRALLRTSMMATHTREQLDRALSAFEKVGRRLGILR